MMDTSRLKRKINPMPEDIEERLINENLMEAYRKRPPYQQNDYLGWILKAKRPETREKRITQMLESRFSPILADVGKTLAFCCLWYRQK